MNKRMLESARSIRDNYASDRKRKCKRESKERLQGDSVVK